MTLTCNTACVPHSNFDKCILIVYIYFCFNLPSWSRRSGPRPQEKTLMGLFLPCSHMATASPPQACLGKTEVFESLVLTAPSLEAGPALRCPKGRLGRCVCKEIRFKAAPLRTTPPRSFFFFPQVREKGDAYLELRGTVKLTNTQGQDRGHASTSPSFLSNRLHFYQ